MFSVQGPLVCCLFVFILFKVIDTGGHEQKAKACLRCLPMAYRSTLIISGFYPYPRGVEQHKSVYTCHFGVLCVTEHPTGVLATPVLCLSGLP